MIIPLDHKNYCSSKSI